jgi:hypothetical protein
LVLLSQLELKAICQRSQVTLQQVLKKTARPRPAGKPTKKPITQAQKEAAAMDALMKKRAKVSKKNDGMYPNYKTN